MATLLVIISWYLLLGISESFNINKHAIQSSHKRQPRDVNDDNEFSNEILTWKCPTEDSVRYISEYNSWYKFLNSLYCKFSEYKIQAARRNYNVSDIEEWGNPVVDFTDPLKGVSYAKDFQDTENQGIVIHKNNFQMFLDIIEKYNIAESNSIKNITITELKLEELNHVLDLTIRQIIYISCKEPHIFIKGNYVLISEIYHNIWKGILDEKCKSVLQTNKLKFLNIFALNTLFIDDDMPTTGIFERVVFIAPKWQIIGKRKIEINGKNGELETKISATSIPHVYENEGEPGNPGGPGGNFLGIGEEFINAANLTISVNGGNGSPGEEGENGRHGNDGITPTVPSGLPLRDDLCDNNKRINGFKCELIRCKYHNQEINSRRSLKSCKYELFGENGIQGGDGWNGGKGGRGGKPGHIELVELHNYSGISQVNNSGMDGVDGRGGSGGFGGKRGNNIVVTVVPKYWSTEWSLVNSKYSHERAALGQKGLNGANLKKRKAPKAAIALSKLDQARTINQYKSYLRENVNGRFKSYHLLQFLKLLENNNKIKSFYDTLGLKDELQSLEGQFYRFNENTNLLPFYESLLKRICEYAENSTETINSRLFKKVLGSLYAATLGRIHNLEAYLESNLITNITAYLESVKSDIEMLKKFRNSNIMEEVINKYKQSYKNEIDKKVKDAIDIIAKDIKPELDNISADIDRQVESFINEITFLQQQARLDHIDHELLNQKYQQVENVLVLQNLISSLKFFCQVASFLGPVGVVPSLVVGVGGTDSETVIFSVQSNLNSIPPPTQSVADLELLEGLIKYTRDKKIGSLKKSLESISQEANKHPDTLSEIYSEVADFINKLDKITWEEFNYEDIQNLEFELKTTLQKQEIESSNSQTGSTDQNIAIRNMQRFIQLSPVMLDYYNKYKYNQAKVDIINNVIKQDEYKFFKLKQYENKFYNTIVRMLQTIENDAEGIVSNTHAKSKTVLEVANWKVKNILRDMFIQMQQLTQEFEVKGDLANCIEKMKEATFILINLQDHVQEYKKLDEFGNVISDLNSITLSNTYFSHNLKSENDLRHALSDLEIIQTSSIVMQRYKVAINAFKEYVFPFARYFLSNLPADLKIDGNKNSSLLENLVFVAMTEINQIKSNLEEFKESVKNPNECIGKGEFNSNYVSSKTFFVWKNEQHKSMISKLLSGEIVTVKADITYSSPDKDVIKFNILDFNFKSKDGDSQFEINNALKGYQITATHLGNSYYRYDNKTYLMMTPSQTVWYSFERKYNGEPVHKSLSYDRIKKGDFMLSPYALWKIKLHKIANNISFKNLEKFKDEIDLELGGYGHYINNRNMYCSDLEVEKYYKAINAYREGDSNFQSKGNQ